MFKPITIGTTPYDTAVIMIDDWYAYEKNRFYTRNELYIEVKAELNMCQLGSSVVYDYIQRNPVGKYNTWQEHSSAFQSYWISRQDRPRSWMDRLLSLAKVD